MLNGSLENTGFNNPRGTGLPVPGGPTRFMKGAGGKPSSPDSDLGKKHWSSVGLSRDMSLNSPIPIAIKERLLTYVIGEGLVPEPHLNNKYLNISSETARDYEALIAKHYKMWETSKQATWEQSLTPRALEKVAFQEWIVSGDFFFSIPYTTRPNWPYSATLKIIAPDFVRTPQEFMGTANFNRDIMNGIERNASGEDSHYWIANFYHGEESLLNGKQKHKAYRVQDSATGRKFIHHAFSPIRLGQRRGIPFIAPIVESIQAITHLSESQLISAVISSYFNVIVTDEDNGIDTFNEAYNEFETVTGGGSTIDSSGTPIQGDKDDYEDHELELGHGSIQYLPGSKKITIANPNKESGSFEPFFKAIVMQIGAATGIAYEVLMMNFTSSYSASRAALLMSFRKFLQLRKEWVGIFKKPVYEEFIIDLARQGVIPVSTEDLVKNAWKREAWSTVQWRGPTMGTLDPVKEIEAAKSRIEAGLSTKEIEFKEYNNEIGYSELRDTWADEQSKDAELRNDINQRFPLNVVPKTTITRAFYDQDAGGSADLNNPKETLKASRKEKVKNETNQ